MVDHWIEGCQELVHETMSETRRALVVRCENVSETRGVLKLRCKKEMRGLESKHVVQGEEECIVRACFARLN